MGCGGFVDNSNYLHNFRNGRLSQVLTKYYFYSPLRTNQILTNELYGQFAAVMILEGGVGYQVILSGKHQIKSVSVEPDMRIQPSDFAGTHFTCFWFLKIA